MKKLMPIAYTISLPFKIITAIAVVLYALIRTAGRIGHIRDAKTAILLMIFMPLALIFAYTKWRRAGWVRDVIMTRVFPGTRI